MITLEEADGDGVRFIEIGFLERRERRVPLFTEASRWAWRFAEGPMTSSEPGLGGQVFKCSMSHRQRLVESVQRG